MNGIEFDLTTLAILWLTASAILIPLLVLAVRFAVVPLLETLARLRTAGASPETELEQRLARTEARLVRLTRELERLAERNAAGAA